MLPTVTSVDGMVSLVGFYEGRTGFGRNALTNFIKKVEKKY